MFFGGKNSPFSPLGEISQSGENVVFFEFFGHKNFKKNGSKKIDTFYPNFQQVAKNIEGCQICKKLSCVLSAKSG